VNQSKSTNFCHFYIDPYMYVPLNGKQILYRYLWYIPLASFQIFKKIRKDIHDFKLTPAIIYPRWQRQPAIIFEKTCSARLPLMFYVISIATIRLPWSKADSEMVSLFMFLSFFGAFRACVLASKLAKRPNTVVYNFKKYR